MTKSLPAGIVLSAIAFGAAHAYQGWRGAAVIALGGALSGVVTHWRKSVRPVMVAHGMEDLLAILVSH